MIIREKPEMDFGASMLFRRVMHPALMPDVILIPDKFSQRANHADEGVGPVCIFTATLNKGWQVRTISKT